MFEESSPSKAAEAGFGPQPKSPSEGSVSPEEELLAMSEKLGQAYEELTLLHRLSGSLGVRRPTDEVLQQACAELAGGAGLHFVGIGLADGAHLGGLAGRQAIVVESASRASKGPEGEAAGRRAAVDAGLAALLGSGMEAFADSILEPVDAEQFPALAAIGHALVAVPLPIRGTVGGWLLAGPRKEALPLTSAEAKMAESVAGPLAIFLENQLLFEEAHSLGLGVIASLVRAIDAKDPYTRGHSQRVGGTAAAIGRELGFSEQQCERLELAGWVHDLGKIGVPEAILLKEGRLTEAEFARIQEHPRLGAEILEGLAPLADLLPAVRHHHERWDGSGYPEGLSGESIPLAARIVGLADAVDAIQSRRSYRDGSTAADCLAEVQRCAGSHFDPRVVAAFVRDRARAGERPGHPRAARQDAA